MSHKDYTVKTFDKEGAVIEESVRQLASDDESLVTVCQDILRRESHVESVAILDEDEEVISFNRDEAGKPQRNAA